MGRPFAQAAHFFFPCKEAEMNSVLYVRQPFFSILPSSKIPPVIIKCEVVLWQQSAANRPDAFRHKGK
jgi:hypothetical protein